MKGLLMYIAIVGLWVTSVVADGNAERWGWMAMDILAWPLGVVRGLLLLVGLAG